MSRLLEKPTKGIPVEISDENERYIYRTHGVCPPEIHFQVQDGLLTEVRFVGGGCPGNARLVSRLLKGLPCGWGYGAPARY